VRFGKDHAAVPRRWATRRRERQRRRRTAPTCVPVPHIGHHAPRPVTAASQHLFPGVTGYGVNLRPVRGAAERRRTGLEEPPASHTRMFGHRHRCLSRRDETDSVLSTDEHRSRADRPAIQDPYVPADPVSVPDRALRSVMGLGWWLIPTKVAGPGTSPAAPASIPGGVAGRQGHHGRGEPIASRQLLRL
jgi:hypothetical protein